MQFTCGIQHPPYDVLGIDTGVETSSKFPHHSHGHNVLDFFPNLRLHFNQITVSTGVRMVFGRPGFFSSIVDPVARTESTHLKIVFRL